MGMCKSCGEIFGAVDLKNGYCNDCGKNILEEKAPEEKSKTTLINCIACGKEISKNAKMCPNCGEGYETDTTQKNEKIELPSYAQHPSMLNRPILLLAFIFLISVYGIGLVLILIWKIYNSNTTLSLKSNIVSYGEGIFTKNMQELKLGKISKITIYQKLTDRIFNIGDIEIYTSGDKPEIIALGFSNPKEIKDAIQKRIDKVAQRG